ncbi:efflux RND transporter periplasmic adaptor subunit [Tepidamorphus sp. 3E244]|uniref:efflux RND transporter periplasmic adaptor subunit n=1 Tax=Tepidamorphus sp. 3E244 TaxID=3385498 RepID=UPI0038FC054D
MNKSYLLALAIVIGLGAWIYSGSIVVGGQEDTKPSIAEQAETDTGDTLQRVSVRKMEARERQSSLLLRGRTQAEDRVDVRAETEGTIEELAVSKGQDVSRGDLLCRLDTRTREAQLAQAEAQLVQAEEDYSGALELAKKGYTPKTRVRTLKAQRDAALASVEAVKWDMARTAIHAPIDGIVETLEVRRGSLLRAGDVCAGIVSIDPMLAFAQVSERELAGVRLGIDATVRPVTGGEFNGKLTYISAASDPATRTFRIEVTLDNGQGGLRDGVTAEIEVPLPTQKAHLLPGSALVLRDSGDIGVRTVGDDQVVKFHSATILADEEGGVWVGGLPDNIDLIVQGQEYVVDGAKVEPVIVTAEAGE